MVSFYPHTLVLTTLILSLFCLAQSHSSPFTHAGNFIRSIPHVQRTSSTSACRASLHTCLSNLDEDKPCEILPTPRRLAAPPLPPGTFKLSKLRPGVFLYDDGVYLTLIIFRVSRLALVDFPDSAGSNTPNGTMTLLTTATEQVLNGATPSRIDMIYSHAHFDHIGAGTRYFNYAKSKFPDVPLTIWASETAYELLKRSKSNRAPVPTAFVTKEGHTLLFGKGFQIKMELTGGHTQSDLLIHIPPSGKLPGIAMLVDIVFPGWSPYALFSLADDLGAYLDAHKQALRLDFEIFIGGHPNRGTRRDVHRNLKFVKDIIEGARQATSSTSQEALNEAGLGRIANPDAPEYGNIWYAFLDVVRTLEIRSCYRAVLEKWGCKLAGIDSTLESHCFVAIQYNFQEV